MVALNNHQDARAYAELRQGTPVFGEADEVRFRRGLLVGLGLSGVLYAGLGALLWSFV